MPVAVRGSSIGAALWYLGPFGGGYSTLISMGRVKVAPSKLSSENWPTTELFLHVILVGNLLISRAKPSVFCNEYSRSFY